MEFQIALQTALQTIVSQILAPMNLTATVTMQGDTVSGVSGKIVSSDGTTVLTSLYTVNHSKAGLQQLIANDIFKLREEMIETAKEFAMNEMVALNPGHYYSH